jgi:hypothetical protein
LRVSGLKDSLGFIAELSESVCEVPVPESHVPSVSVALSSLCY